MGRKILADAGYDVSTVNNGSAALKRVADFKPDLIVLDVYMPGYSGLEVCQRLKDSDETAQIPVLLSVGKLEPFKPEEARRVGADAHIVKPFEASELLTAITRLEDLMVTQPRNGLRQGVDSGSERFRSAGNGKKSESNSAADTGWKTRLGFSSKKKKEEKEEVEDASAGTFRDFRKGKRNGAGDAKKVKQASGPEPIPVADFPGDITKDELDALSALAAKLEGSILPAQIPQAEEDAPAANDTADEKTSAAAEAPGVASGSTVVSEVAIADAAALQAAVAAPQTLDEPQAAEAQVAEQVVESAIPESAIPESSIPESPSVESPVFAVDGNNEIEIPVEHVELQSENAAAAVETDQQAPEPAAREYAEERPSESQPSENQLSETSVVIATTVNAAQFAQEPACVDRDDEPGFASPAYATAQVTDEPAPSDAELVQALRLLTPANWNPDTGSAQSQESLEASKAALREESPEKELSHRAADGPRWVAEPVALSPEEAAISLEAEMFRTFAVLPVTAPGDAVEPVAITGVSAIEAAVENRLAAADLIAAAKALLEPLPESVQEQGLQHLPSEYLAQDSAHPASAHHEPETRAARTSIAEASEVSSETVSPAAITDAGQGLPSEEYPGEASRSIALEANDPPKAKAAAAAAEGAESTSGPDATTIASIVDRVMADLRPKIVEEITRKLSGK
jgi:twitching motility two-component system response regulator PilH